MIDIITFIVGWIGIDLAIIYMKYSWKNRMKEDIISWKIFLIIQIPILIMISLLFICWVIVIIFLLVAMITCTVLGFYLEYKGKKSATQPIEAEIIDINFVTSNGNTFYLLTLKYSVNGVDYINKNLRGFENLDENMKIGKKMVIKYNPKNPEDICY